jgi:hypothetical protein
LTGDSKQWDSDKLDFLALPSPVTKYMDFSVIVVFHDMPREAPRTLYSLSREYQRDCVDLSYEVIALDHGSNPPLPSELVERYGSQFSVLSIDTGRPSPIIAINEAVRSANGRYVVINIDGARILSPGILSGIARATRLFDAAFVHTLGFHIGPGLQNETMLKGYDQQEEDRLLKKARWQEDGYRLFEISELAGSSSGGFLSDLAESNCFAMPRQKFLDMGGFHPAFQSPGGGLANLDIYRRIFEHPGFMPVRLLGEGTFHQIHGGVATNVPREKHPWARYAQEYERIYERPWSSPVQQTPFFLGKLHPSAKRFVF